MGRSPCCSKVGLQRGPWSAKEDNLLTTYIQKHGEGQWRSLPKKAGLLRCGKSCRLRWMNYLKPGIKRGNITSDEEDLIIRLHKLLGNRWSLIAGRLPGRTDNEIKNYWNTHIQRKLKNSAIIPQQNTQMSNYAKPNSKTKRMKKNKTSNDSTEMIDSQRVLSFAPTINNTSTNMGSGSWSNGKIDCGLNLSDVSNVPWPFLELEKDGDGDFHFSIPCSSVVTTFDDSLELEKVYNDYFRLLQAKDNHV